MKALQMFRKSAFKLKATHWPSCRYPESAVAETEILPRGKHITLSQDNSSRLRNFTVSGATWKEVGEQNLSEEYKEPFATLQPTNGPRTSDILTQGRENMEPAHGVDCPCVVVQCYQGVLVWKERRMELYIPKVSISGTYDLKGILMNLGVTDVFSNRADLSGITGNRDVKVSKATHKALLKIHENGTEAAAASSTDFLPHSAPPIVKFNRPFLLFIVDQYTQSILFMGRIVNPTEK